MINQHITTIYCHLTMPVTIPLQCYTLSLHFFLFYQNNSCVIIIWYWAITMILQYRHGITTVISFPIPMLLNHNNLSSYCSDCLSFPFQCFMYHHTVSLYHNVVVPIKMIHSNITIHLFFITKIHYSITMFHCFITKAHC